MAKRVQVLWLIAGVAAVLALGLGLTGISGHGRTCGSALSPATEPSGDPFEQAFADQDCSDAIGQRRIVAGVFAFIAIVLAGIAIGESRPGTTAGP